MPKTPVSYIDPHDSGCLIINVESFSKKFMMSTKLSNSPFGVAGSISSMSIEQIYALTDEYKDGDMFHSIISNKDYSEELLHKSTSLFNLISSSIFISSNNRGRNDTEDENNIGEYFDNNSIFVFKIAAGNSFIGNRCPIIFSLLKASAPGANSYSVSAASSDKNDIENFFNKFLPQYLIVEKERQQKIGIILSGSAGIFIKKINLTNVAVDVATNYGADFFAKKHDKIVSKLTDIHGGLYLFHGIPGSGKTTYIRHLTQLVKDRLFVFVPSNHISCLTDPKFLSLLIDQKNPVLVLEDAEKAIETRETSADSSLVSNILNISNGLLSSVFNTSIIVTFNTGKEQIDKALKRKGRLMAEHQFDKLSQHDAENVFKSLGKNIKPESSLTLAEIYNYMDEDYTATENRPKIGF